MPLFIGIIGVGKSEIQLHWSSPKQRFKRRMDTTHQSAAIQMLRVYGKTETR